MSEDQGSVLAGDASVGADADAMRRPDAAVGQNGSARDGGTLGSDDAGENALDASSSDGTGEGGDGGNTVPLDASMDAMLDSGADAATADAGSDGSASDAGVVPDAAASVCSDDDRYAWRDFHLGGEVVSSITQCLPASVSCASGDCTLDRCLAGAAGVTACESCVAAEVRCIADLCYDACKTSSNDPACRACACAQGCVAAFDSCAGAALDVCADCDGTTCINASVLPPELMMVVVMRTLFPTFIVPAM